MQKQYFVYILTNKVHTVLYVGVTSDLAKRVYQHRMKLIPGFTSRYNVSKLVFYEVADNDFTREADQGRLAQEEDRSDQQHESAVERSVRDFVRMAVIASEAKQSRFTCA